jgi:hypothetical protein
LLSLWPMYGRVKEKKGTGDISNRVERLRLEDLR